MIKKYENPIDFDIQKEIHGNLIQYISLLEVSQGGPVVGKLLINKKKIPDYSFGGPFLCNETSLFAPAFIRRFFVSGFKIARINLSTLNVTILTKRKDIFFLDKIEDNKIYYYEDMRKTKSSYIEI